MLRNVSAWTANNRSVQTKSSEASKIPHLKEFQNLDISYKKKKKKRISDDDYNFTYRREISERNESEVSSSDVVPWRNSKSVPLPVGKAVPQQ